MNELGHYLGRVIEITGFLKISRSFPIVSLDFLENLEVIRGINNKKKFYSLYLLENENLAKLFPLKNKNGKPVRIYQQKDDGAVEPGQAFIHYNAKLCRSEIQAMINASGIEPTSSDISFVTNGDKAVCSPHKLAVQLQVCADFK